MKLQPTHIHRELRFHVHAVQINTMCDIFALPHGGDKIYSCGLDFNGFSVDGEDYPVGSWFIACLCGECEDDRIHVNPYVFEREFEKIVPAVRYPTYAESQAMIAGISTKEFTERTAVRMSDKLKQMAYSRLEEELMKLAGCDGAKSPFTATEASKPMKNPSGDPTRVGNHDSDAEKMAIAAAKLVTYDPVAETKHLRRELDALLQLLKESKRGSQERSIAMRKLQEAIMWLGMDLKAQNEPDPYPQSKNPSSPVIEPTADGLKL